GVETATVGLKNAGDASGGMARGSSPVPIATVSEPAPGATKLLPFAAWIVLSPGPVTTMRLPPYSRQCAAQYGYTCNSEGTRDGFQDPLLRGGRLWKAGRV